MKNNVCKIINDLLPNYISGLTSYETNNFIKKHLEECNECKTSYEKMIRNINVNDIKEDEAQVKGFKKINKRFKILEIIIILLLVILLIGATYYWNYWKKGYMNAAETEYELIEYLNSMDAFYATIEKITDVESYDNSKIITVKGLDINDKNHRREYEVYVPASIVKIFWDDKEIKISDLKVGQTIQILSLGEPIYNNGGERTNIQKIVVLDDNIY